VWVPKVYNGKDRTFFFVAYEGFPAEAGHHADRQCPYRVATRRQFFADGNRGGAAGHSLRSADVYTTTPGNYARLPFPNNMCRRIVSTRWQPR